ncbi:hypothetical protein HWV62_41763 [Athelia sp. TMB]|nr:hypothetical protein HWV62_41763 [Athelia sp. TMB]
MPIGIYRRSLVGKRFPGKKYLVAEFKGQGIDLMNEGAEHELANEAGGPISSRIIIRLDAAVESRAAFMDTVNRDVARLTKVKGADGVQLASTISGIIGTVLQKLIPIIDNFASTHPVLNLSWLALSAVYKAVQNQIAEEDIVRDLVEGLREMAGAASECPDLLVIDGTVDVIEEIGRTSLDIALLIHRYANPSIKGKSSIFARTAKYAFSDMSSQIANCKGRCADLTTKLSLRLQIETNYVVKNVQDGVEAVQVEVKEIRGGVKGIQDDQKKRDIDKWMSAPDSSSNYKTAREKHQEGTGSWLVNGSVFRGWKDNPGSVLWLHGGPGCGKTILCSSAIEDVKKSSKGKSSVGYAYFFFDGTSGQSKLAAHESLVRSIIMQFSDQFDGIPPALVNLFEDECNGRSQPLIGALENTLLQILQFFHTAYIIVDALDECSEGSKVLKWIHTIVSQTSDRLHLMVTSRPEPEIKDRLRRLYNLQEINIATQRESDDIHRYIDARLAEIDKWTDPQKKMVRDGLSGGAYGVFRWVSLQFDVLVASCASLAEIEHRLRSLPRDLDEAYAEIIKKSPRPAELVLFLQWIIFGQQDFTAQELAEVALINFDDSGGSLPFCDPSRRYGSSDTVLSTCYGLVVEVQVIIKISHFSVKEFFLSKVIQIGPTKSIRCTESTSHQAIAKTCIAYLLQFNELDSVTRANIDSFPLALYAAQQFAFHVESIRGEDVDATLEHLIQQLVLPIISCALINWHRLQNWHLPLERRIELWDVTPTLYSTIITPLAELVNHLINKGKYGITLHAASDRGGCLAIAQLLLEKGADVNATGGEYGTALQAATCQGLLEVVKLLLENGADVNAMVEHHGTALQAASSRGLFEIAQLLVEKGADANITGGKYGTALQAATCWGRLDIARMLLENGAYVNATGGQYGTALQAASYTGRLEIFLLLLQKGADVNATGGQYGTALQAASCWGALAFSQVLLDKGADVNITGGEYGTALHAASYGGETKIVRLLLERGAEVNAKGGKWGSALQAARATWKDSQAEAIVQLLKEYGALDIEPNFESDNTY